MNKKIILLFTIIILGVGIVLLLLLQEETPTNTGQTPSTMRTSSPEKTTKKPSQPTTQTYQQTKFGITQSVEVEKDEDVISFDITSTTTGQTETISGKAEKVGGEYATEIISDENGYGIAADVFVYQQGDCFLYLYLEQDTGEYLSVTESPECGDLSGGESFFDTQGTIKVTP